MRKGNAPFMHNSAEWWLVVVPVGSLALKLGPHEPRLRRRHISATIHSSTPSWECCPCTSSGHHLKWPVNLSVLERSPNASPSVSAFVFRASTAKNLSVFAHINVCISLLAHMAAHTTFICSNMHAWTAVGFVFLIEHFDLFVFYIPYTF